jgi:Polysaccharide lyase family 8, C-terminal beta-sandwich domain
LITTIKADGSWPDINYKDTSRTGFQHREHLEHMVDLGRAYKKQGSPYYQDMNVIQAVFYKAGKIQVANNLAVTAESPCMVLIEMDGKQIKKKCGYPILRNY